MFSQRTEPHPHLDADARGNVDRLVRSSVFLMASSATMALLGFFFWIVVARNFSPEQVGVGTSLISAISLIAYLSLLGLNGTLVRFMATSRARDAQITESLVVVGVVGIVISLVYLMVVPLYAPSLAFVADHPLYALVFLLAGAAAALNLLTDAVFIGARKPEYNLLLDGLVQGLVKLVLPIGLLGLGAYGIFGSVATGYVVVVVLSLLCMRHSLGFRFTFQRSAITKSQFTYSISTYVSSGLAVLPTLLLPLITLHTLGESQTAYFALAFQIALTLYGVSYAVGEAMFAEGSFDESKLPSLLKRSALLLTAVQLCGVVVLIVSAPLVLRLFGAQYREHALDVLVVLAVGAVAVALHTWADFVLKVVGLMRNLVISGVICVTVTIGMALLFGSRGLTWFGWAWVIGNLVAGLYGGFVVIMRQRRAGHDLALTGSPDAYTGQTETADAD
ncbi:lipopolysaccharide biosynthesis protein [Mycobacterium sp. URHB0021]|jgi:O-antigen/teichoic acid export membrane protein